MTEESRRQIGSTNPSSADPYTVGYKKPPLATQFKPGQSGNSKGRPKGQTSAKAVVNAIANSKVAITENGKRTKRTMGEIAIMRLFELAVKGDKRAISEVIKLMERFEPVKRVENSASDEQMTQALLSSAVERFQRKMAENKS